MSQIEYDIKTGSWTNKQPLYYRDFSRMDYLGELTRQPCDLETIEEEFGSPLPPEIVEEFELDGSWDFVTAGRLLPLVFVQGGEPQHPLTNVDRKLTIGRFREYSGGVNISSVSIQGIHLPSRRVITLDYGRRFNIDILNVRYDETTPLVGATVSLAEEESAELNRQNHEHQNLRDAIERTHYTSHISSIYPMVTEAMAERLALLDAPRPTHLVSTFRGDERGLVVPEFKFGSYRQEVDLRGINTELKDGTVVINYEPQQGSTQPWTLSFPANLS